MSKHTPGPWSVGGPTEYAYQLRIDPSIGVVYGGGEEVQANAHLIAAAPQLLKALERLFDEYDDRRSQFGSDPLWKKREDVDAVEEARRVLEKLKGVTT